MKFTTVTIATLAAALAVHAKTGPEVTAMTSVKRSDVAELQNLLGQFVSNTVVKRGEFDGALVGRIIDITARSGILTEVLTNQDVHSEFFKRDAGTYDLESGSEYLTARDMSLIITTVWDLISPIITNLFGTIDWNSIIVQGGTYLVATVEQVYQWAVELGALDKAMDWVFSNLGSIILTVLSWVFGSFSALSSPAPTTALTPTANAKRLMY